MHIYNGVWANTTHKYDIRAGVFIIYMLMKFNCEILIWMGCDPALFGNLRLIEYMLLGNYYLWVRFYIYEFLRQFT